VTPKEDNGILDRIDALLLAAPVLWYAQVIHQAF